MAKANKKEKSIMKKFIISVVLILICALTFVGCKNFGSQFDFQNAGRTCKIKWIEVNVREEHSQDSTSLGLLSEGDSVTLTGNEFHCFSGENLATDSWVEIQLEDGSTAWIVMQAIKW